MKWFENNSWRLEKCHSRFFVTPDLFRGRISLFTFFFSLVFLVFLSACTDYVSQIDDRYGEWETSESIVESSSSKKTESSSSATSSSSNVDISVGSVYDATAKTLLDLRDSQTYKTVTIGSQTWMAENLNYETPNSYCYNDGVANCFKYGRLYTWAAAVGVLEETCGRGYSCYLTSDNIQGVCPSGWHLPSKAEFETLFSAVGGQAIAGAKLKSTSGWSNRGDGADKYSFSALPAGARNSSGGSYDDGLRAYFWSSSEYNGGSACYMFLGYDEDNANLSYYYKVNELSVRCLKDEVSELFVKSSSSVKTSSSSVHSSSSWSGKLMTDSRDGQTYKIITIGTQTWMAQNLNYETENSYCYNDTASYCAKYGRLYMWAVAVGKTEDACGFKHSCSLPSGDIQGVCPVGWHLPSQTEWNTLFTAVGGQLIASKVLKSKFGWYKNGNGTDVFLFSALPAGDRYESGNFDNENYSARFWSSTENGSYDAYDVDLNYGEDKAFLNKDYKYSGYSVRCIQNDISAENVKSSSSSVAKSSSSVKASSSSRVPMSSSKVVGTCGSDNSAVNDEYQVSWKFTKNDNLGSMELMKASFQWTFDGGTPGSFTAVGMNGLSQKVTYATAGDYGASLVIGVAGDTYRVTCPPVHVPIQTEKSSSSVKFSSSSVAKSSSSNKNIQDGSEYDADNNKVKDLRDNQVYRTVTIDKQVWMAENLNYESGLSYCYDSKIENCAKYGRLYTWATAMDSLGFWSSNGEGCGIGFECSPAYPVRGVCPKGWHLPNNVEWETLLSFVDDSAPDKSISGTAVYSNAGNVLKSASGWSNEGNGVDTFSFSALPAGYADLLNGSSDVRYKNEGSFALFWSSTEYHEGSQYGAYNVYINPNGSASLNYYSYYGLSVRCVKD